jgi:hypothetical protein
MPQKKITPRCIGRAGESASCLTAILYDGGDGVWITRTPRQRRSRPVSPVMGDP